MSASARRSRHAVCRLLAVAFVTCAALAQAGLAEPKAFAWAEGETPAKADFEFEASAPKPHLLSDGKMLLKALDAGATQSQVPADGWHLDYGVDVPEAGSYEVWARVSFEGLRPALRWRVGDGDWTEVSNEVRTTNVMALGEWFEIAWLHLGEADLAAGPTTLQIHYPRVAQGERMLVGLDCVALTKGRFVPEGGLKPGQTYDAEIDKQAAEHVYRFPAPAAGAARSELKLDGPWQLARFDDPDMTVDRFEPVMELPSPDEYPLRWMGFQVPGSLWAKDEMVFGHRCVYRTRVDVPEGCEGRGFYLHFSGTNFIASVFVNGRLAGTHKGVWIPWDQDVSNLVRPGEVNEIAVAIKGHYYALDSENYKGKEVNALRNLPHNWSAKNVLWLAPIYPSTKGDGDGTEYGIVNPVTLVAVGDVYTEDVFVKTSVRDKRLEAEVTVRNASDGPRSVRVLCEAVNDGTGAVEKKFGPADLAVPAGGVAVTTVAGDWQDPKLWWPVPGPDLYRLRTTITENAPVDVQEELFGFREVTIKGTGVYINGVRRNFWNWVNVYGRPWDGESWLAAFRGEGDRFTRFSQNRTTSKFLRTREERLEFYDRNGIPGRLCSMIDGMFITQAFGKRGKNAEGENVLIPNEPVWENNREHLEQLARAYRNHPSVIMYQAENEYLYITGTLRYRDVLDQVEELFSEVIEAARKVDPTRPYSVGGGGALGGRIEINSPHYPDGSLDWYPENAYTLEKFSDRITTSGWAWKRDVPWIVGESAFAAEVRYGTYALGDEAFKGRDAANRGKAMYLRMLYGGYRWADAAGFFPWDNLSPYEDGRKVFHDLYVIPRKQTTRLFAGRENRLLFKVMNDTLSAEPLTFEWTYEVGGRRVAGETVKLQVEPGFGREQTLVINAPPAGGRLDGVLTLKSSQAGAEPYVDVRSVPVLPTGAPVRTGVPVTLFDRSGKVEPFLKAAGVACSKIEKLADSKRMGGLLIIGPDALTADEAFGQDILSFAALGGAVVVLEQEVPAAGRSLPAPLDVTEHYYGYVHPQALGTPVFKDLGKDDLIDWAGDHPTCKRVYVKPSKGARSLAECGDELKHSALIEVPCGRGVIVLCQLRVGAKLGVDPAADVLLRNMIEHYSGYRPAAGVAAVYAPGDRLLADNVAATGAQCEAADSLAAAVDPARYKVAVVKATPENLAELARIKDRAEAFQDAGGWIMLCGLDPTGVDAFNALMGTDHIIRPFRLERVTMENSQYALAATLGNRDVALISPTVVQHGRKWVSMNTFSHVIDGLNVAPFCVLPEGPEDPLQYDPVPLGEHNDRVPYNLVNGMSSTDHWRYYMSVWIEEGADSKALTFKLRRPETIAQVNIWSNSIYWAIRDLDVVFDGDESSKVSTTLPVSPDVNEIKLPEPRQVKETITLVIRSWQEMRPDAPDIRLVGIDNVEFLRAEPPEKAVFIDSVGGLVAFPRGAGGVFLSQVKFMAKEPNPENVGKKRNLVGVILQNMGVGSGSTTVAVPGANVRFQTVNLTDWCNAYGTEHGGVQGWFGGEKGEDLTNFQVGERQLGGVTYHVPDYATAPVPNCIVLGLPGYLRKPAEVRGIEVGARADLLYFLHAAFVPRSADGTELARYVVHYADGEEATVPVVVGRHAAHWEQAEPVALPEAAAVTSFGIPAVADKIGVLYSMEWRNPRPEVAVEKIDVLQPAGGPRGMLGVLGITAGTVVR